MAVGGVLWLVPLKTLTRAEGGDEAETRRRCKGMNAAAAGEAATAAFTEGSRDSCALGLKLLKAVRGMFKFP